MDMNFNCMCRGDGKASIALSLGNRTHDGAVEFSVSAHDVKKVPHQVYGMQSTFEQSKDEYVLTVPLLRATTYTITAVEVDAAGNQLDSAALKLSTESLKWKSRFAYRFQREQALAIRDIDSSGAANQTSFDIQHLLYEPEKDCDTDFILFQGSIVPKCLKSTFEVSCIDQKGNTVSRGYTIAESKQIENDAESSTNLRRRVDYSVSTQVKDRGTLIFVVEETPCDASEEKPQPAIRAMKVKKAWKQAAYEPANRFNMPKGGTYNEWFTGSHKRSEAELQYQRECTFSYQPVISILVPLYKTPRNFLFEMIESVTSQTYPHWELCLANASKDDVVLSESLDLVRQVGDSRIKIFNLESNDGISENTNQALKQATGDFVSLLDHDDLLEPDALYEIVKAINADDQIDMLYSDEDHMISETREYVYPNFKSDFNIDFLRTCNYITHMTTIKRSILEEVGGFNQEFDGAQDFDVILKSSEKARKVHHIPRILYHWREHANSTSVNIESKPYAIEAGRKALDAHFKRIGLDVTVENTSRPCVYRPLYKLERTPKVSIIVADQRRYNPTVDAKNNWIGKAGYSDFEIIVARTSNESGVGGTSNTEQVRTVVSHAESIPAMLNEAAQQAQGEYLLFADASVEVLSDFLIENMLGFCMRQNVGAVGAKSYYPDLTIENAGIAVTPDVAALPLFRGATHYNCGYQARAIVPVDVSAVSAACMMTPAAVFQRLGGFSTQFALDMYDVDYCLRLGQDGKQVVFDAYAEVMHHVIRSLRLSQDRNVLRQKDMGVFGEKWAETIVGGDPYMSPNVNQSQPFWNLA